MQRGRIQPAQQLPRLGLHRCLAQAQVSQGFRVSAAAHSSIAVNERASAGAAVTATASSSNEGPSVSGHGGPPARSPKGPGHTDALTPDRNRPYARCETE